MEKTENQEIKSKRQSMTERLQSRYPDKDFSDDEVLMGQIYDDYDGYDKDIAGYQEREKAFSDMFTSDPRSARFLTDWRNGEDPVIGLVRQFGTDIKDAIDDPERQEAIAAANKEFVERVAKEKELEETYQQNLDESLKMLDELQQSKGYSDDQVDAAMAFLIGIVKDGVMGKFSPESIDMALKALNHDQDVATANQEGLVQGKNTKVEQTLRKPKQGDGTASLGGGNARAASKPRRSLGALDNFGEGNQTIWERGGEKRQRYS